MHAVCGEIGNVIINGEVYCNEHRKSIETICLICKEPIDGKFIKVDQFNIHVECYKCEECKETLIGKDCRQKEEKLYCVEHFKK